jgi:hypothetical protein
MKKIIKNNNLIHNSKIVGWITNMFGFMVLNATFNIISFISWRSVLLVEENRVPGESYRPVGSH